MRASLRSPVRWLAWLYGLAFGCGLLLGLVKLVWLDMSLVQGEGAWAPGCGRARAPECGVWLARTSLLCGADFVRFVSRCVRPSRRLALRSGACVCTHACMRVCA